MLNSSIFPSDVKKKLTRTPWLRQDDEKEIVANNLVTLANYVLSNQWGPFTWQDYVSSFSHRSINHHDEILEEFTKTGYLDRDSRDNYIFTEKFIKLCEQYC